MTSAQRPATSVQLRVLHAHSGNLYGGVETIMITLARTPVPDVTHAFALCERGRLAEELQRAGAAVSVVGRVRFRFPWSVRRARRGLGKVLAASHTDIVVCHSPWAMAVFAPAVRAHGRPLAFWLHGTPSGRHWVERLGRRHPPDRVLCASRTVCQTLPRLYRHVPSEVVYPPIAQERAGAGRSGQERETLRRELGVAPGGVVIVQVGRMEPGKGQEVLLDALTRLPPDLPWACWLVGGAQRRSERQYERWLRREVEETGLGSRVRFLDERRDVARLLEAADVFCHPNVQPEGFGIVFVEALYAGLPVIATNIGGGREIVNDQCGKLVPADDVWALVAGLRTLIGDAALRRRLGENGPTRALEVCDPRRQAERVAEALRRTAAGVRLY